MSPYTPRIKLEIGSVLACNKIGIATDRANNIAVIVGGEFPGDFEGQLASIMIANPKKIPAGSAGDIGGVFEAARRKCPGDF
jgi:hypothetical protein